MKGGGPRDASRATDTSAGDPAYTAPVPLVPLPARIAVLLSGRGSNFAALEAACRAGDVPARITLVVSDVPEARGLVRARERGLETLALPRTPSSVPAFEERLDEAIERAGADLICLAGFMRLLSRRFVERHRLRILNVHPSLLPSFPGLHAQRQALRHGVKVSGVTVHFVDAGLDSGPVVAQAAVRVEGGDDEASLAARILEVEHRLYPAALKLVLEGGWRLEGRILRFPEPPKIPL